MERARLFAVVFRIYRRSFSALLIPFILFSPSTRDGNRAQRGVRFYDRIRPDSFNSRYVLDDLLQAESEMACEGELLVLQ